MTKNFNLIALGMFIGTMFVFGFGQTTAIVAQETTASEDTKQRPDDPTVVMIVQKHLKAVGGAEAIGKINSIHRKGSISGKSSFGPFQGVGEEVADLPSGRSYSAIDLGSYKRTSAFDGNSGWAEDTQAGKTDLPAGEVLFAKLGSAVSPLLAAHRFPEIVLELEGEAEFEGKKCSLIVANDASLKFYVNQESQLLEGLAVGDDQVVSFADYKEQEGVKFPGRRTMRVKSQSLLIEMTYSSTETNGSIDESIFEAVVATKVEPSGSSAGQEYSAEQVIAYMDKDDDGKVSKDEASAELKTSFGYVDTNSDGLIDLTEAKAMLEYTKNQAAKGQAKMDSATPTSDDASVVTAEELVKSMDKDGDDKISKDEADEDLKLFFADYDKNDDGLIDTQEAQAIADFVNGASSPSSKVRVTAADVMEQMDTDGDGKITMEEAPVQLKENFGYIDTNKDGIVDVNEAKTIADYMNLNRN
jgi:Ca2+-binding EF-hand superfamily protein